MQAKTSYHLLILLAFLFCIKIVIVCCYSARRLLVCLAWWLAWWLAWRSGVVAQCSVAQWRSGVVAQWRSGVVMQWRSDVVVRQGEYFADGWVGPPCVRSLVAAKCLQIPRVFLWCISLNFFSVYFPVHFSKIFQCLFFCLFL